MVARAATQGLSELPARFLILLITIYQKTLSRVLGPRCRFWPSCSAYASQSLSLYPLPTALKKTSLRLLRCHPFHPGGIDLP